MVLQPDEADVTLKGGIWRGLTPDTCPDGELVFEQSSELDEDVDVGVIETELLFPKRGGGGAINYIV